MKKLRTQIAVVVLSQLALLSAAMAQSPVPFGYWEGGGGLEKLLIQQGQCSLSGPGAYYYGPCSWNSTSKGGVLTIINQTNYQPAPIYFNVMWIDNKTISVYGDIYHLKSGG